MRAGPSSTGLVPLYKRPQNAPCSLQRMRTKQEDKKQEQVLPETEFAGTWVLDFQPEEL